MAISREQQAEIEKLLWSDNGASYLLADGDLLESYALLEVSGGGLLEVVKFKNGSRTGQRSTMSSFIEELHGYSKISIITAQAALERLRSKLAETPYDGLDPQSWRAKW